MLRTVHIIFFFFLWIITIPKNISSLDKDTDNDKIHIYEKNDNIFQDMEISDEDHTISESDKNWAGLFTCTTVLGDTISHSELFKKKTKANKDDATKSYENNRSATPTPFKKEKQTYQNTTNYYEIKKYNLKEKASKILKSMKGTPINPDALISTMISSKNHKDITWMISGWIRKQWCSEVKKHKFYKEMMLCITNFFVEKKIDTTKTLNLLNEIDDFLVNVVNFVSQYPYDAEISRKALWKTCDDNLKKTINKNLSTKKLLRMIKRYKNIPDIHLWSLYVYAGKKYKFLKKDLYNINDYLLLIKKPLKDACVILKNDSC